MLHVPFVRITVADAREVRPRALRTPLERMVIHGFRRQAVMPVTLHLVAERTDHLAVADITSLADVDVAPGQLQRRVGPHALHLLDGVFEIEERCDFHDAADRDDQQGADQKQRGVAFDDAVFVEYGHRPLLIQQAAANGFRRAAPKLRHPCGRLRRVDDRGWSS
ncbi:hypothetical protein D3C86_1146450 [compost metagenome]